MNCGLDIGTGRRKALPSTTLCVDCASGHPSGQSNRTASEPLGSRQDFLKDRRRSGR
ncbi:MAG: TraR/DksA C4-type zinc finger protein [Polymorphobacter sp.]